jgi:hypothetical protein
MSRAIDNITWPAWTQAWGSELVPCEAGLVGDQFCATGLSSGAAKPAGLCAHLSGITSVTGVPDGWFCTCSIFHSGPLCSDVSPGAYAVVAGNSVLALYFCTVTARLWRAQTVIQRSPSRSTIGARLLSSRLFFLASIVMFGSLYLQASLALPSGLLLDFVRARQLEPVFLSIFIATGISGNMCLVVTVYESSQSGSRNDSSRSRRLSLALGTVLLCWMLAVAIHFAGHKDVARSFVYVLVVVSFCFFTHASLVLSSSLGACEAVADVDEHLRVRLLAANRRLRNIKRNGLLMVTLTLISVPMHFIGLSQLSAPVSQLPSYALWGIVSWLRWLFIGRSIVSMADFLDGPISDATEPSILMYSASGRMRTMSGEHKVTPTSERAGSQTGQPPMK